ncbi:hypothetical protein [Kutzneria buriramensis]|uniref:Uncharacterized protein n=1 Tax=Kutzneria buriramensis TaxID=1045776 RepID=A0A3E0G8H8_9PSEU|nr:hypothetical protein [Kutzneria buriramensis]REH18272.1 hypothetical protein BCF44_13627 [Kutzneria buriramensis]
MSTPNVDPAPSAGTTATPPADTPVIGTETAPVSLNEYAQAWATGMRQHWTPPDLWENGRPALKQSWMWAMYGQHLPDDEQVRLGSRAGTGVLIPFRALFLYLDWIFERWSRVIAAAVLVLAVIQAVHPIF